MAVNPLLLSGLLGGLLASLACGTIGPYVISRRFVSLSGAVAHTAIGGVGIVVFLRFRFAPGLDDLEPLHGAVIAALVAALLIGLVQHHARESLDTLIGALWSIGMAVGLLLIKFTPGYHVELFSYLFGNIAMVSWADVKLIAVLDLVILVTLLFFHKRLLATCLDEEYAHLQGINVLLTNLVLLSLVALTTVALIRVVGLILVIALLSLPAATAAHFTRRMPRMIVFSVVLSMLLTALPRMAVYGTRLSPESAIILAAGAVYLLTLIYRRLRQARSLKKTSLKKQRT
ncbi:MAG: metal ABC transporter permease [Planctomycetes bacterium]|nr:metal ABC transporter permease [Planctomycetota bacterium]